MPNYLVYTLVSGAAGLLLAIFLILGVNRLPPGMMSADGNAANSESLLGDFLNKYYIIATGGALVAFCMLGFIYGWLFAVCFLAGILTALLLLHQTATNLRRAGSRAAAAGSSDKAVAVLLCAAGAVGLMVFSTVFLGCGLLFFCPGTLSFFVLGIAAPALFYAVAGNFFAFPGKSGVYQSEPLLPESCPTAKPISAVLHMGTTALDLYASCAAVLAGATSLGALGMARYGPGGALLPLSIFAAALPAYMIILLVIIVLRKRVRLKVAAVSSGFFALFMLAFALLAIKFLLSGEQAKLSLSFGTGWAAAILLLLPWYFKLPLFFNKPQGYNLLIPVPVLLLALALAYYTAGFYGMAIAALAVTVFTGIAVFIQILKAMWNYSWGLVDGVRTESENLAATDELYQKIAAGQDRDDKPVSCFNICSAVLASAVLLSAFIQMGGIKTIPVCGGVVWFSLVIGCALPWLFSGWMAGGERKASEKQELAGSEAPADVIPGTAKGGFSLSAFSNSAYGESLLVLALAVAIPLLTGILLGKRALAALLIGVFAAGTILALLRDGEYSSIASLNLLLKFLLIVALALVVPFMG